MTASDRFWAKVDKSGDCWLWTGWCFTSGYAAFWLNGKATRAHRFAYEDAIGPVPEGLVIDHLCRVRHCVNPTHLEAVTQTLNVLRGESPPAVNAAKTLCIRGHELSGPNLYVIKATGYRRCTTCAKASHRARKNERSRQRHLAGECSNTRNCDYCAGKVAS